METHHHHTNSRAYSIITHEGNTPQIHPSVYLADGARVIGRVKIAEEANIWFNVVIRGDVNHIEIGSHTNIQDLSTIHVTYQGHPTRIGDHVTVGHMAMLHACTIGNNTLIGMGATILDGAVIGDNCLVGANSLITQNKKFPAGSLIMGSPAVVKRSLTPEEIKDLTWSAHHYVKLAHSYQS